MKITIELPEVMTASIRGIEVSLDLFTATPEVQAQIATRLALYGMRKFNDAAPMGLKAPVGDEKAMEKFKQDCADNARHLIAKWLAGDFEADRSREPADPVSAKAREIARRLVVDKYGKLGKDATDAAKAEFNERVTKAAGHAKVIELAKAELAKAAALDIDI